MQLLAHKRLIASVLLLVSARGLCAGDAKRRVDALGDPLPAGAVYRLGTERFRHPGPIRSLTFTSDGKALISKGWEGEPIAWDVATGKRIPGKDIAKELLEAYAVASPDGRHVVSFDDKGKEMRVRDKATGKPLFTRKHADGWAAVGFRNDGTLLALSCDNQVTALNLADGAVKGTQKFGFAPWPRFAEDWPPPAMSLDGSILAGALKEDWRDLKSPVRVRFWDPLTGKEARDAITLPRSWKHWTLSRDGKHLTVHYWDSEIQMWDTQTSTKTQIAVGGDYGAEGVLYIPEKNWAVTSGWETVYVQDLQKKKVLWSKDVAPPKASGPGLKDCRVNCFTLSSDGKTIAAGTDNGHIELLELATGERVGGSRLHPGFFGLPFRFRPDGKTAIVTLGRKSVLWDLVDGKKRSDLGIEIYSDDDSISADGKWVVHYRYASKKKYLCVTDLDTGKDRWSREEEFLNVRISDDGASLAIFDWTKPDFRFLSTATGQEVRTLQPRVKDGKTDKVVAPGRAWNVSPDLTKAALLVDEDKTRPAIQLWDVTAQKPLWTWRMPAQTKGAFTEMHFVPGGKLILIDLRRGPNSFIVLDATTGGQLREFNGSSIFQVSPNGQYVAYGAHANEKSFLEVRDLASGEIVLKEKQREGIRSRHACFSADSKVLACNLDDTTIEFFDLQTAKRLGPPRAHTAYVRELRFAPAGRLLAACYNDSTVIVWDADSRAP